MLSERPGLDHFWQQFGSKTSDARDPASTRYAGHLIAPHVRSETFDMLRDEIGVIPPGSALQMQRGRSGRGADGGEEPGGELLEDGCITLSVVASDIFGVSGRAMMAALIGGERDPKVLAEMARAAAA